MKKHFKNGNFYLAIAFLIMALLFWSSSQTYAEQSQIGLLEKLLHNQPLKESLGKISFDYAGANVSVAGSGYFSFVEFFIRKGAHFFTYFVMGGAFFLGIFPKMNRYWLTALFSWLAATGYAGLDEFHQMLTGGRTPLFQDVFLDSMGALTGVAIALLIRFLKKK